MGGPAPSPSLRDRRFASARRECPTRHKRMLKTFLHILSNAMGEHLCHGISLAQSAPVLTEVERIAHYRDLAVQFRQWAETETNHEARAGLLDMARQYERLAKQRGAKS